MSGSPSTGPRRRATSAPPLRPWASGSLGQSALSRPVAAYTEALKEHTREQEPLKWAATQNNLGVALTTLGKREPGPERLKRAVAAYHRGTQGAYP